MNTHALTVIEFPRTLSLIAERAVSPLGAERVRELAPMTDRDTIERELARVAAVRSLLSAEEPWTLHNVPDARAALTRLRVEGASLSAPDLLVLGALLRSSRLTRESFRGERISPVATAVLAEQRDALIVDKANEALIEKSVDDEGQIRDEASSALKKIRRDLRASQGELIKVLERAMAKLEPHQRVADMSVTIRNGRYVIPVRREAHGAVGGIVHDASATGGTLFIEPPAAVEAGNRIRELQLEEGEEIDRILAEVTERLRPQRDAMLASLEALIVLDSLVARARFAIDFACHPSELADATAGFTIVQGRHPLLVAQGIDVVPFDLAMPANERTLLISGPNTGGKTVLLKALGLLSALVQSGIPAPVNNGSTIAIFDDIYADVGDEQSILASLSTFSAHLKNLAEVLTSASDRSLVLIDELGSGTDPIEGAALGGAILEALTTRGTLTIATTHLGALKELATQVDGVVNASLQFDPVALAPTYRLTKGIPGRSYGISIARRLQLPPDVLTRAEERVPVDERRVTALLADLESREKSLTAIEKETGEIAEETRQRSRRLAERERNVRERERQLEQASRREARQYLLEARAEVEQTIRELKAASEANQDAAREARKRIEELANQHGRALEQIEHDAKESASADANQDVNIGDFVEVETLGGRVGRVVEVRDGEALVAVGAMKLAVPRTALRISTPEAAAPAVAVNIRGDMPEVHAQSEIDVRGMRVGEVEDIVMHAVDAAVRADLKTLRIIHGKGTGALRERVAEMLRKESRVTNFRLGAWNEGGAGVTVVELK
ncbi:MAG TPA: endonuclease MutS2 [Gemmatimonadaceae bacterium]|nr:endonuclease MutS2 [Gemmatimonadaceae bacterium]